MLFYNFQIGYKHEKDHRVMCKIWVRRREERDVGMKNSQIWMEVSWHKNAFASIADQFVSNGVFLLNSGLRH